MIQNNSIVELRSGEKYYLTHGQKINGINFCLLATVSGPIQVNLAEIRENNGVAEIKHYTGADYKDILFTLLKKINSKIL